MDNLTIFINRLKKIGIEIQCSANYPWIYIDYIQGKRVTEKYLANHGFTVAFRNKEITFTDLTEIFNLIRKYK